MKNTTQITELANTISYWLMYFGHASNFDEFQNYLRINNNKFKFLMTIKTLLYSNVEFNIDSIVTPISTLKNVEISDRIINMKIFEEFISTYCENNNNININIISQLDIISDCLNKETLINYRNRNVLSELLIICFEGKFDFFLQNRNTFKILQTRINCLTIRN